MSDAIEAVVDAVRKAVRDCAVYVPVGAFMDERLPSVDSVALQVGNALRAALTAYEAAKGGGVGVKPLEPVARQIIHELAADIRDRLSHEKGSANWRNAQRIVEMSRPITSLASGERDAVIEVTDAMVETVARALAADELGMGDPPTVVETIVNHQWPAFKRQARVALAAALRMEGK